MWLGAGLSDLGTPILSGTCLQHGVDCLGVSMLCPISTDFARGPFDKAHSRDPRSESSTISIRMRTKMPVRGMCLKISECWKGFFREGVVYKNLPQ